MCVYFYLFFIESDLEGHTCCDGCDYKMAQLGPGILHHWLYWMCCCFSFVFNENFKVDVVIDGSCSLNESSTTLQKQFGVD